VSVRNTLNEIYNPDAKLQLTHARPRPGQPKKEQRGDGHDEDPKDYEQQKIRDETRNGA
jgi:hypothetical protein